MTSKELVTIIRAAVRVELRTVVREEIERAFKTVIAESKKPTVQSSSQQQKQPATSVVQKSIVKPQIQAKKYSTDPTLNKILNETAQSERDDLDGQDYNDMAEWSDLRTKMSPVASTSTTPHGPLFNVQHMEDVVPQPQLQNQQPMQSTDIMQDILNTPIDNAGDVDILPSVGLPDFLKKSISKAAAVTNASIEKSKNKRP